MHSQQSQLSGGTEMGACAVWLMVEINRAAWRGAHQKSSHGDFGGEGPPPASAQRCPTPDVDDVSQRSPYLN